MSDPKLVEMAREVRNVLGPSADIEAGVDVEAVALAALERAVAEEREACAQIVEGQAIRSPAIAARYPETHGGSIALHEIAASIRARGTSK